MRFSIMGKSLATFAVLCGCTCFAHATEPAGGACRAPSTQGNVLTQRAETISRMEQMSETCLKALLVACDDSANQALLDLGSAAMCSMGYEALLRKGSGGSSPAMMMWRREASSARRPRPRRPRRRAADGAATR